MNKTYGSSEDDALINQPVAAKQRSNPSKEYCSVLEGEKRSNWNI